MKQQLIAIGLAGVLSSGLMCSTDAMAQETQADPRIDSPSDQPPVDRVAGEDRCRGEGREGGRGEGRRGDRAEGIEPSPPPGRGHGGSGSGRGIAPLTADDLEEAMEVLNEIQPDLARRLREIVAEDPDNAVRILNERFPRVIEMLQMKRDDPQRFALHMRSMNVMREMRPLMRAHREAKETGDENAIALARSAIREQVETLFDIRMELRLMEIQDLRDQVAELEEQLEVYRSQREALIDQQVEGMTSGRGRPHGDRRGDRQHGNGDRPGPPRDDDRPRPDEGRR